MNDGLAKTKRDMLDALPRYYDDSPEVDAIIDTNAEQISKTRQKARDLTDQFFVRTATHGLDDWERVLGLPPRPHASLTFRRNRILARLNGTAPATVEYLEDVVNAYVEDRSAKIVEVNGEYRFIVDIDVSGNVDMEGIRADLDDLKPAHLDYAFRSTSQSRIYAAPALVSGENVTVYPWQPTELVSGGFSRLAGTIQTVDRMTVYPDGLKSTYRIAADFIGVRAGNYM